MKLITMPCSLAVLLSTLQYAQTSGQGRITGTVVNEDGQPVVQGLRVSWRWEDTGRNATGLPIKAECSKASTCR